MRTSRLLRRGSLPKKDSICNSLDVSYTPTLSSRTKREATLSSIACKQSELLKDRSYLSTTRLQITKPDTYEAQKTADFSKIINNLDMIIKTRAKEKPINLRDNVEYSYLPEKGKMQYFRIECNGKKCPLNVDVNKSYGSIKIFVSKNYVYPSETVNDMCIERDSFCVSDYKFNFTTSVIGMGIMALADTKYSISINFGNETKAFSYFDKETKAFSYFDKVSKITDKNFIKINRNKVNQEKISKSREWELRQAQAVERRKFNLKTRTQRSWMFINRNEVIREEERKKKEEECEKTAEKERHRGWVSYIYLVPIADTLKQMIRSQREKKMADLYKIQMVRKIQLFWKDKTGANTDSLNLLRTLSILKLFSASNPINLKTLSSFIATRAFKFYPTSAVLRFRHKIETIQKAWRTYARVARLRRKKLAGLSRKVRAAHKIKASKSKRILAQSSQRCKKIY